MTLFFCVDKVFILTTTHLQQSRHFPKLSPDPNHFLPQYIIKDCKVDFSTYSFKLYSNQHFWKYCKNVF